MVSHALLQGDFPNQGSNPCLLHLLHWQAGGFFTTSATWEPLKQHYVLSLIASEGQELWSSLGSLIGLQSDIDKVCGHLRLD